MTNPESTWVWQRGANGVVSLRPAFGKFINTQVMDPAKTLKAALLGWVQPLGKTAVEDRPEFNGTNDVSNNRNRTPYSTRLKNMASYTDTSTPVAGWYGYGGNQIVDSNGGPLYIIPYANHPRRLVQWRLNNGTGPDADLEIANGLQSHFQQVPIPIGLDGSRFETFYKKELHAAGPDQQLSIYDPFTDEYWEFWVFSYDAAKDRYEVGYGGYQANVSKVSSRFIFSNNWGSRATGIPLTTVISRSDWENGLAQHTIGIGIPVGLPGFIPPATRQDGHLDAIPFNPDNSWIVKGADGRDAIPEGAVFRLPPSFVVERNKFPNDPNKSKAYYIIAKAIQDYGLIIYDTTGGSMTITIESDKACGTPYSSVKTSTIPTNTQNLFWGPEGVMHYLPWSAMEQVKYVF